MTLTQRLRSPMSHLVDAIHDVRPHALVNPSIDNDGPMQTVTVTYVMTPELIKAWGDKCAQQADGGE